MELVRLMLDIMTTMILATVLAFIISTLYAAYKIYPRILKLIESKCIKIGLNNGLYKPKQPIVVAFTGKLGSGKTYFAKAMEDHGAKRIRFAEPIKEIATNMGFPYDSVYGTQKQKATHVPDLGVSFREFAQKFGTDIVREQFPKIFPTMELDKQSLWIKIAKTKINKIFQEGKSVVVIDDLRFKDEAAVIKDLNGIVIRLRLPGEDKKKTESKKSHASETELDTIQYDASFVNDKSPDTEKSILDFIEKVVNLGIEHTDSNEYDQSNEQDKSNEYDQSNQ